MFSATRYGGGAEIHLEQLNFEALANRPVEFQMFYSGTRLGDKLGEIVALSEDEITSLPAIRTVLRFGKKDDARGLHWREKKKKKEKETRTVSV